MNTEEQGSNASAPPACLLSGLSAVSRTTAQAMLILANLTVAMIELNVEERLSNGNA